jgi:hypothetical protein
LPASEDVPAISTPLDIPVSVPTGAVYVCPQTGRLLAGSGRVVFGLSPP